MPLSQKKQMSMARARRVAYVLKRSITGNISAPFMDANWDDAARRYIETGDESLKEFFPKTIRH